MADRQHLYLLKQNLNIWNEWRKNNPEIEVNLIEADLSEMNLRGANLANVDLSGAKLISAELSEVNFTGAYLAGANLSFARLVRANLSFTYLAETDLSFANLEGANISAAYLSKANFSFADLHDADLSFSNLTDANFSESDARSAQFSFADLNGINFYSANLVNSSFKQADLSKANFIQSDLTNANLVSVNLTDANLTAATAFFTNFQAAIFTGSILESWKINSHTILNEAICDYIYLKSPQDNNSPESDSLNDALKITFAPGEFTKLFQKTREIIKLNFDEGIDWGCFLSTFKLLKVEQNSAELYVKAIEANLDGSFMITIEGYFATEKEHIEEDFWQNYNAVIAEVNGREKEQEKTNFNEDILLKIIEAIAKD